MGSHKFLVNLVNDLPILLIFFPKEPTFGLIFFYCLLFSVSLVSVMIFTISSVPFAVSVIYALCSGVPKGRSLGY